LKIASALLCDYASVREGLLHVLGGGITRMWRDQFPAPINASIALVIELHRDELDRPHELLVRISDEDGAMLFEARGGFQMARAPLLEPHETQLLPMALDLRPAGVQHAGPHQIDVSLDGEHRQTLTFAVRPSSERQADVAGAPPPSPN
jgi:hypothetical protein